MPRPLRWSGCNLMLAELRTGPKLATELRRHGDPVHTLASINKELRRTGALFRIRSRRVHVPTRYGRVIDRLYALEPIPS